jgi:hypothetical protein
MIEQMRQHLVRLRDLTAQLNSHSDDANRVAMAVESFLTDTCHVGVEGQVWIDGYEENGDPGWSRVLVYGRYNGQYRLYVAETDYRDVGPDGPEGTQTLWANCPRDIRLAAYEKLPDLLANLVGRVEARIEKIRACTEAINEIIDLAPPAKKGGKK